MVLVVGSSTVDMSFQNPSLNGKDDPNSAKEADKASKKGDENGDGKEKKKKKGMFDDDDTPENMVGYGQLVSCFDLTLCLYCS